MVVVKLAVIRRDDTMNAMERVIWVFKDVAFGAGWITWKE